jgi:hypothetical protein
VAHSRCCQRQLVELVGKCEIADDQTRDGVAIYRAERSDRAREYFGGENGRHSERANVREVVLA